MEKSAFELSRERVEREREEILKAQREGTFSLSKQLEEHPIYCLADYFSLPDDHPLTILKNRREANQDSED